MTVYSHPLKPAKTALIDMALEKYKIRSIVDLAKADTPWSAQFPHIINDSILASKTK
jgi:hypothetical protein